MQATCEHGPGSPSNEYKDGWMNSEACTATWWEGDWLIDRCWVIGKR